MAEPQRISFEPDPPQAGKILKICYSFENLPQDKTQLEVSFNPAVVSPATYDVTRKDPCLTLLVPEADSILVQDLDGPSPDKEGMIE
jgi:hypothetical protein